jgi:hypothetical protein
VNLVRAEGGDLMLVNIEEDAFSLVGITNSEISLYRQKSFALESPDEGGVKQRMEDILFEIQNTLNVLEDREKCKIATLWVRTGLSGGGEDILSDLSSKLATQVKGVDSCLPGNQIPAEKRLLSPLVGQML